jgi:microcystin-dependent protein
MPFIGEVRIHGGNFPPSGWAFCNGQILAVASYPALFNVIGARFGGNGTTTFALPDLRGRTPLGPGQGPGLALRALGEAGGVESHTLTTAEMPAHAHGVLAASANGVSDRPDGNAMARTAAAIPHYGPTADTNLAAGAVASAGSSAPHNNMQPYLVVSYIIALQGDTP